MQGGLQKILAIFGVVVFGLTVIFSLGVNITEIFSVEAARVLKNTTTFLLYEFKANGTPMRFGYVLAFIPLIMGVFIFEQLGKIVVLIMLGMIAINFALMLGLNGVLP